MRLNQSREEIGQKYIDENEVAWAAGLFEGEGYIGQRLNGQWQLEIQMTDVDVVKHYASMYGINVRPHDRRDRPNSKVIFRAATCKRDLIFKIVSDFYPYLGERRREKCDEFLAWYQEKNRETSN